VTIQVGWLPPACAGLRGADSGSRILAVGGTLEAACANAASGPAPTPDRRVSALDEPSKTNMTGGAVSIVALAPTPLLPGADIAAMSFAFDLSSYEDVCENAEEIHSRLADGTMPCDAPWSEEDVERVRRWIDAGMAA
jgi:hypothetical protein